MYLFFENPSGDLTWLFGHWAFFDDPSNITNAWRWQWTDPDLDSQVASQYTLLVDNGTPQPALSPPFSSTIAPSGGKTEEQSFAI